MVVHPTVRAKVFNSKASAFVVCDNAYMGMLIKVDATISETPTAADYYFDVSVDTGALFATDLDSGLSSGDDYPVDLTTPAKGAAVKMILTSDDRAHIRVTTG